MEEVRKYVESRPDGNTKLLNQKHLLVLLAKAEEEQKWFKKFTAECCDKMGWFCGGCKQIAKDEDGEERDCFGCALYELRQEAYR